MSNSGEILIAQIKRLQAEVTRLRAALQAIATMETTGHGAKENYYGMRASQYARDVLSDSVDQAIR